MDAIGELMIGGLVIIAIIGVYFLLSCYVPVVADPPPGTEPKRVLSGARLAIGVICLAVCALGVMLAVAGAGLGSLASH